ncbi:Ig-like domain-containing protein [Eubacteriales bacterium OttesenSCG-928-K08]|nr:Ig-like domain-containing protein [Eubacteriales bacterium OttesenSCG-928-K08]
MKKSAYKITTKFISPLVVLALCLTMAPMVVFAEDSPSEIAGCGHEECAALSACLMQATQSGAVQEIVQAVDELAAAVLAQTVHGGIAPSLPEKLPCIVDGKTADIPVIWNCEAFDENVPGTYTFTATVGDAYALANDVTLPQITVTVKLAETAQLAGEANQPAQLGGVFITLIILVPSVAALLIVAFIINRKRKHAGSSA